VASPNKASITLAGNPGGEVDHFPETDVVIRIHSDDDESSDALANTNYLLPISTLPMEWSRTERDPKKQRGTNQLSFDAWKMSWNNKLGRWGYG
jgi:hypothetical protein